MLWSRSLRPIWAVSISTFEIRSRDFLLADRPSACTHKVPILFQGLNSLASATRWLGRSKLVAGVIYPRCFIFTALINWGQIKYDNSCTSVGLLIHSNLPPMDVFVLQTFLSNPLLETFLDWWDEIDSRTRKNTWKMGHPERWMITPEFNMHRNIVISNLPDSRLFFECHWACRSEGISTRTQLSTKSKSTRHGHLPLVPSPQSLISTFGGRPQCSSSALYSWVESILLFSLTP